MRSPKTTTKTTELARQLMAIGLRATAHELDDFLAQAIAGRWSPLDLLAAVANRETADRAERGLQRRLTRSRIGRFKSMADFDWNWPDEIDRHLVERALALEFLREGRNLVLLGPNGIGKTMIAKNLAHTTVLAGHSVLFRTAAQMIDELSCDSREIRRKRLRKFSTPALVVVDEVGYLSFDDHAADLFYTALDPRYEARRSTIITTNLPFSQWNSVFPSATSIATLIDRLTHHADILTIKGKSYRVRESQEEQKKRRPPKKPKPGPKVTPPTEETP